MSADDGLRDEMRRFFARRPDPLSLDEVTTAWLLSGQLDPADAPPRFAGVARVLGAAAAPGRPDELVGEDHALATYRLARRSAPRPRRRARGLRLAAMAGAALLLLGGVAGAVSTGALPDGAQSVAHDALGAVGVSVPAPNPRVARRPETGRRSPRPAAPSHPSVHPARPAPPTIHSSRTPPSTAPRNRRPTDAQLLAACRAYLEGRLSPAGDRAAANADRYLATRAGGAPNVTGFCQGVVRSAGP